jgi:hypothetical protein
MKAKALSFVFISFSESGLFNALQPIQIKNFFPLCASRSRLHIRSRGHPPTPTCAQGSHSDQQEIHNTIFVFPQENASTGRPSPRDGGRSWPHC